MVNIRKLKQLVLGNDKKTLALLALVILVLNVLLYMGTVNYDFLKDDFRLIVENSRIKDFDAFWESMGAKFFAFPDFPYLHYWRPMTLFTFYLDYQLWGLHPPGYHLFNIIINGLNGVLVLLLFYMIMGKTGYAFMVALFFTVHPSHVEAAAWISGRTDLLSTFFIFTAILFFLMYLNKKKKLFYVITSLFFLMALLSKENGVLFPLLAGGLVLLTPDDDGSGPRFTGMKETFKKLLITVPFWVMDIGYVVLHNMFTGVQDVLSHFSLTDIFVIAKTIGAYARIILLPFFPTPHFSMHYFDGHDLEFLVYFFVAVVIITFMIIKRENYKYSLYSLLFFIFLLPVLDPEIVPSYPKIVIRFAYIPALFAGVFFLESFQLLKNKQAKKAFVGLLIFIGVVWTFETYTFQDYYKDKYHHYNGLLLDYPDDGSLLLPLALIKAGDGKHGEALGLVSRALKTNDNDRWLDVSEMGGLLKANLMVITGDVEGGRVLAEKILAETGKQEMKYFGFLVLAKYYEKRGDFPAAFEKLREAGNAGETADLFYRMALIQGKMGDYKQALFYLEKAKGLNPELKNYKSFKQFLKKLIKQND
ncbi:MAG: hypothetical protein GY940_07775 [bacterium]|nr:hypothetical protein [bacterium]